jgi:hypothetical protein
VRLIDKLFTSGGTWTREQGILDFQRRVLGGCNETLRS